MTALLAAWMELVAYLYDGRMLALVRAGTDMVRRSAATSWRAS